MVLGTAVATFRISPIAPLRVVGLIYVEIFRNIPLMSLIIVVVYALPEIEILLSYETAVIASMSITFAFGTACESALASAVSPCGTRTAVM